MTITSHVIKQNNKCKDTNKNFSSWVVNMKGLQNGGTIICNSDFTSPSC